MPLNNTEKENLAAIDPNSRKTLTPALRRKVNKDLFPLGAEYHREIPLDAVFEVLNKHGVIPLQEDYTYWSGFLTGRTGKASIELGWSGGLIVNSVLFLSWYKMESGKYELICYLT